MGVGGLKAEGFIWTVGVGSAYEVLWENKQMSGLIRTSFGLKLRNVLWGGAVNSVLRGLAKLVKAPICHLFELGLELPVLMWKLMTSKIK